jgi:hypothetical protein
MVAVVDPNAQWFQPAFPEEARVDQTIKESASEFETKSQDVAFETWLREQPWNRGGSVLHNLLREAMGKAELADPELTTNSRGSPSMAN